MSEKDANVELDVWCRSKRKEGAEEEQYETKAKDIHMWRRGDVGAYQNAVHKEALAVDEEMKKNMETAWEAENDKDECIVNLEGQERDYWLEAKQGCWGAIGSAE